MNKGDDDMAKSMQGIPHSVISDKDAFKKANDERSTAKIVDITKTDLINQWVEQDPGFKNTLEEWRKDRGFFWKRK